MKKINTSPISGMQELLPPTQAIFEQLKSKIAEVYHRHGFLNIETPIIDRTEILLAKAGGDTEKQIYKVVKTAETADDADQALRFDHTVPLARYVVEHEQHLAFPFQVSQIGRNFRGERAQKGRFREFYQCDVDIIGRGQLPIYYDAEVIAAPLEAIKSFRLKSKVVARISNRKILNGLLEGLNLQNNADEIFSIIDHSEKVSPEETHVALEDLETPSADLAILEAFIKTSGDRNFVINKLRALDLGNETFIEGINELESVMLLLEAMGLKDNIEGDMRIVRGLDYYTGTVFEFCLPDYKQVGSVGGGGRYENLADYFTEQKFPGVGGSIGLSRLFYIITEYNLLDVHEKKPIDYAIIPISDKEFVYATRLAADLRRTEKCTTTVVATDKKLGPKLSYAAKIAKRGIVIGEKEVKTNKYQIKEF